MRQLDWPPQYNERTLATPLVDDWHGNEAELLSLLADAVSTFETAVAAEDFDVAAIFVGEAIGRFDKIRPAAEIVVDMAAEALPNREPRQWCWRLPRLIDTAVTTQSPKQAALPLIAELRHFEHVGAGSAVLGCGAQRRNLDSPARHLVCSHLLAPSM